MLRLARHLAFLLSLVLAFCISREARADAAAAEVLFKQGKDLMGQKKYAEACPKFEESQRLDPGLGTQTNLAICYEGLGRTASAWSLYLEVASQAKATNQPDREKKARDAAKALEPKLSNLVIKVESPPPGLEVKRNGQPVGQASWGSPLPVDPGEIHITAMAPNKKLWETTIKVEKPGETTVTVPELEKGQPPPGFGAPPPGGTVVQGFGGPPPPLPPRMKRRSSGMFGGGIAMVSVGSLGLLVGAAWWGLASIDGDAGAGPPAVTVGSAALLGGGIAMIVIGGKKVPATDGAAESEQRVAEPVSPVPEVSVGLGSVQAKWQF